MEEKFNILKIPDLIEIKENSENEAPLATQHQSQHESSYIPVSSCNISVYMYYIQSDNPPKSDETFYLMESAVLDSEKPPERLSFVNLSGQEVNYELAPSSVKPLNEDINIMRVS